VRALLGIIATSTMGWGFEWDLGKTTETPFVVNWLANPLQCNIALPGHWSREFRPPAAPVNPADIPQPLRKHAGNYAVWEDHSGTLPKAYLFCKPAEEFAWRVTWTEFPHDAVAAATDTQLRLNPVFPARPPEFFLPMLPPNIMRQHIDELLCDAVPALSKPTGITLDGPFAKTFNLETVTFKPAQWPRNHDVLGTRWFHSDFVDMAYPYTRLFWFNLVKEGGLHALPAH